ncbi:MAG: hypothetical protein QM796_04290 [Chthoniobacteraceae bacterium]
MIQAIFFDATETLIHIPKGVGLALCRGGTGNGDAAGGDGHGCGLSARSSAGCLCARWLMDCGLMMTGAGGGNWSFACWIW